MTSYDSFADILTGLKGFFRREQRRGGGRRPDQQHQHASENTSTWKAPADTKAARLTIVQITDVYTLDNFASLKTMLQEIKTSQTSDNENEGSNRVISMVRDTL